MGEENWGGEGMAQALHDPTVCPIWGGLPGSSSRWEAGGVRSGVPVPTFLLEITW